MPRFDGKVAIVTGAGSGIGRATAELLAASGASVVVAERTHAGAETVRRIEAQGGSALDVPTNVADEQSVRSMVARAAERFGRIDILVNNAAVFVLRGVEEATVEDWREILDVNVMGPAIVSKHVIPHLKKAGGGAIVNLASISSFIAQPNFATYNTTKTAILGLTRCMALDLGPHGIRVNAVCPGAVWTPIVERLTREKGLDRKGADADPQWGGMHMLRRVADPIEIARAIAFLASEEASFITAESMMVDGGYVAQ